MRRDRVISFSAVLGLLIVCGAVLWGGPSFKKIAGVGGDKIAPSPATTKPAATRPAPASAASPVATPTIARKVEPRATPEVSERAGFYVIGLASREEASARAEAQKHKQEGLNPIVVYSSNWSGLTPNYYQVVYGIFANRADTTALRKELEKRGIKTYVMHSGQRVRP
jgi:septal ring-binding cell division protein DamX